MKFAGVFLALPLAFFGWMWWGTIRVEHELRPITSSIAGHPIQVDCQGWLSSLVDVEAREGEVHFNANGLPEPRIFLTRPTCKRLDAFTHSRHHAALDCLAEIDWAQPDPLAHESYHTAGVIEKVTTNCYAIQAIAYVPWRLGAPQREGELAAYAMAALEPHQVDGYATPDCRAGTALDIHPETRDFPTELPLAPPGLPRR